MCDVTSKAHLWLCIKSSWCGVLDMIPAVRRLVCVCTLAFFRGAGEGSV